MREVNSKIINALITGALIIFMSCNSGTTQHQGPKTDTVTIQSMKFSPSEISVNKGDTILFINKDFVQHDVSNADKQFYSDTINVGSGWILVADQSADYFCSIHPSMKGKIVVNK